MSPHNLYDSCMIGTDPSTIVADHFRECGIQDLKDFMRKVPCRAAQTCEPCGPTYERPETSLLMFVLCTCDVLPFSRYSVPPLLQAPEHASLYVHMSS
jgi:hypothetical protein